MLISHPHNRSFPEFLLDRRNCEIEILLTGFGHFLGSFVPHRRGSGSAGGFLFFGRGGSGGFLIGHWLRFSSNNTHDNFDLVFGNVKVFSRHWQELICSSEHLFKRVLFQVVSISPIPRECDPLPGLTGFQHLPLFRPAKDRRPAGATDRVPLIGPLDSPIRTFNVPNDKDGCKIMSKRRLLESPVLLKPPPALPNSSLLNRCHAL